MGSILHNVSLFQCTRYLIIGRSNLSFQFSIKQILIVLSLCHLWGCAAPGGAPEEDDSVHSDRRSDCIFSSSIRGYSLLDESNLIVDTSGSRKYHITLMRRALGLRTSTAIAFESTTGSICAPFDEIRYNDQFDRRSIRISRIRALSPEEHEDLLIRFGKKQPEFEQTPAPHKVKGADVEELDPAATDNTSRD